MKKLKLFLDFIFRIIVSIIRFVKHTISILYGWIRRHPAQAVLIILAIIASWYSARTYYHNVHESKEFRKTTVIIQAAMDFGDILFTDFSHIEVYRPKLSWKDPWPKDASQLGDFRFFGVKPMVWAKIDNHSRHPISVDFIVVYLSFGKYKGKEERRFDYFEPALKERRRFPLFLQTQEQGIVVLPVTWPITRSIIGWLPALKEDSLHKARYLVDAYYRSIGKAIIGTPETYGELLKELLIEDLKQQIAPDSSTTGKIEIVVFLSTGEYFTGDVKLP